jgi:hypothetical protein
MVPRWLSTAFADQVDCGKHGKEYGENYGNMLNGYALLVRRNTLEMEFSLADEFPCSGAATKKSWLWARLDRPDHGSWGFR